MWQAAEERKITKKEWKKEWKKKRKTDNAWENGELSSEDKKNADKKKSFDMFYGCASACQAVPATALPLSDSPPPSAPARLALVMSLIGA